MKYGDDKIANIVDGLKIKKNIIKKNPNLVNIFQEIVLGVNRVIPQIIVGSLQLQNKKLESIKYQN